MKKTHAGGIPIREYNRIHKWISRRWVKTGFCEGCGVEARTQWSNKDQKYTLNPEDWQEFCATCHRRYDRKHFGHTWQPDIGRTGRPLMRNRPKLTDS